MVSILRPGQRILNIPAIGVSTSRRAVASGSLAPTAGMICWLKADAITGLSDGDALTTWTDSTVNGNNATQGTVARKPLYKTGIINGLPAVLFDGDNDNLAFAIDIMVRPCSVFIVVLPLTIGTGDSQPVIAEAVGASFGPLWAVKGSTGQIEVYDGGAWRLSTKTISANTAFVTEIVAGTSSYLLGANGTLTTISRAMAIANKPTMIGARADALQSPYSLNGYIAELIAYGSELSVADRQATEAYLMAKYAIA